MLARSPEHPLGNDAVPGQPERELSDQDRAQGAILLPDQLFRDALVGPSYSRGTKFLLACMLGQMSWVALSTQGSWAKLSWEMWLFIALALVPILAWSWFIFFGRTTIDSKGIRREVPFNQAGYDLRWYEISGLRYLDWPMGARLVIKTQAPGAAKAFHAGNDEMRKAFAKLQEIYRHRS